jgi:indoleamine 2,3-dioxygenase
MFRNLFNITKADENGFLPAQAPETTLPEKSAYQSKINHIIHNLPALLKAKTLRAEVDALNAEFPNPVLELEKGNKAQKTAALCFLTAIAQAYVCEDTAKPIQHLPATIAKPLYALAKSRQRFPMITYSDYVLNNWRLIDDTKPVSLDNIETIVSFSGTKDEAWFIKIHVAIEAVSAKAITAAQTAYHESLKNNPDASVIEQSLRAMTESLNQSIDIMHKMKDNCHPEVFWNVLRPYLGGWEKVKPANCEDAGVRFEGIQTRDTKPFAFGGPSGAQSSIVPALDTALKIKHDIDGMHKKLLEFKEYMPNQHQAFILQFTNSKIKSVAKHSSNPELIAAYDDAVSAVKRMRGAHLGLVHAYIYNPAANQGIPAHVITGTGGAPIKGYLGGRLTDTHTLSESLQTPSKRI